LRKESPTQRKEGGGEKLGSNGEINGVYASELKTEEKDLEPLGRGILTRKRGGKTLNEGTALRLRKG